jgi:hypothetical protein
MGILHRDCRRQIASAKRNAPTTDTSANAALRGARFPHQNRADHSQEPQNAVACGVAEKLAPIFVLLRQKAHTQAVD